ncbi:MAG: hypothetical protein CSA53_07600, partial [Gammaproteobacteria bacterium]
MIRVATVLAALALGACSTTGIAPAPDKREFPPVETREPVLVGEQKPVAGVRAAPSPGLQTGATAYQKLTQKAADARRQGNYRQAMSLLERAQRIRPQNGDIYYQLAQTAHLMGDTVNARTIA